MLSLTSRPFRRCSAGLLQTTLLLAAAAAPLAAANSYLVHNLISDLPNTADKVDPNLVNPWGVAVSPTGPFWVGNNHSGTSTLYDTTGAVLTLVVSVPTPSQATEGAVTGVIFNGSTSFTVATGAPSVFIFCTEDGTISGWNSSVDSTHAKVVVDNSGSQAVYKGCATGGTTEAPQLYAANFNSGKIDVWDAAFKPLTLGAGSFVDSSVPSGFAPFNVQNLGGKLYVTYAKQDSDKEDDVAGLGNGYVTVFDMSGTLLTRLISQGPLNSPWGLAVAPASFGDFAGALLVGNFGDGLIHAFNQTTGALMGTLNDTTGKALTIPGLWALLFGNGGRGGDAATLYFTAGSPGPNAEPLETHGLFGSIQSAPTFQVTSVVNSATFGTTLAANSWATIVGGGLSAKTRAWQSADFVNNQLPTELEGVSVKVNNEAAYIGYISPTQINVLLPSDLPTGPVSISTTNNGLLSATAMVTLQAAAPSFFLFTGGKYIAATHADGSLSAPPSLISGLTTTPVVPGETVVLYANGFGPTSPAVTNGQLVTTPLNLVAAPTVTIGGLPATVSFAGLSATGLYQINAVVPAIPAGTTPLVDAAVTAQVMGLDSQVSAFVSVQTSAPTGQSQAIDIINFSFKPTPVTVTAGAEVVWTNRDSVQHNVIADDSDVLKSSNLNQGTTYSKTLTTPGTYNYHCSIHPSMKATVIVK